MIIDMKLRINIGELFYQRAVRMPNREALVHGEERYTFMDLNRRTNQFARALKEMAVRKGDRVAVLLPNGHEVCECLYGTAKIGAVMVPLNFRLAPRELEYMIKDSGAKILIFDERFLSLVDGFRDNVKMRAFISTGENCPEYAEDYEDLIRPYRTDEPSIDSGDDDNFIIMYTSGTTGKPKGAVLTHENLFSAASNCVYALDVRGSESILILLPLFHIGALTPYVTATLKGMRTVLVKSLEMSEVLETIGTERPSTIVAVTSIVNMMLQVPEIKKYDFSSLVSIILLGSPLPFSVVKACHEDLGIKLQNFYGLTEATGPGAYMNPEDMLDKPGSVGHPFLFCEARIVEENDQDLPTGEVGELILRGPSIMKAYWNLPEETKSTLKNGWLHTGDLARFDEEGFIYIADRKKDMIISGGENIYPAEIESLLTSHPRIKDAAVVAMPHEKWGEVPRAVIEPVPRAILSEEEVIRFCEGKIGKHKIPKKVDFVEQLPRTPTGKVLKRELIEV